LVPIRSFLIRLLRESGGEIFQKFLLILLKMCFFKELDTYVWL